MTDQPHRCSDAEGITVRQDAKPTSVPAMGPLAISLLLGGGVDPVLTALPLPLPTALPELLADSAGVGWRLHPC